MGAMTKKSATIESKAGGNMRGPRDKLGPISGRFQLVTHNKWGNNRMLVVRRCFRQIHTNNLKSLAASLQLSLDSPTFLKLGLDAPSLLGMVAFFLQDPDGCSKSCFSHSVTYLSIHIQGTVEICHRP